LLKKDYKILIVFLGIMAIAGVIIFTRFGASEKSNQPTGMNESQMPPAADTTQMRENMLTFENQLKGNPNNYQALVGLGNTYYDLGNASNSIEYYQRALKINPNDAQVMVDMGAMYRQAGDYEKALELFNKAIEIDPKLPQAYFNLGMVLRMEKHDPTGAVKAWRKYLELEPNSQAKVFIEDQIKIAEDSGKG
jgi:cytochrome c-type biogenesis protein CcmH/NrfG